MADSSDAGQPENSASSSEDEVARLAASVAVSFEVEQAVMGSEGDSCANLKLKESRAGPLDGAARPQSTGIAAGGTWKDRLRINGSKDTLDGAQIMVAAHLDKVLEASIEFTCHKRQQSEGQWAGEQSASDMLGEHDIARLFRDVAPSRGGQYPVLWQSEYTHSKTQTTADAKLAAKLHQKKQQQFKQLKGAQVEAIAVTGEHVTAYAELAARNASKRMQPVSKQENLGPKHIVRCGWGGGGSPLEALSWQHKHDTHRKQ